jgi:signal transduction histidine kinase
VARTLTLQDVIAPELPGGPYPEPANAALTLPIEGATKALAGFLVVGASPRCVLDDSYRTFFGLVAGHIGKSISDAKSYEAERKRAEALAEIDSAKTAFFSNISHEFRTPLTLMLGPVDDMLAAPLTELPQESRTLLNVVQRNGRRLLKLVNTLLDFARIEAGRNLASYQPTDLSALTEDLASNFRSACERAGLRLDVTCPRLSEPAWLDVQMWEKIVLNLLSNAFKFTLQGGIVLRLEEGERQFTLTVRDTGVGIPKEELPRMFERFHRVEGAGGRSYEGSGIGLALVQELGEGTRWLDLRGERARSGKRLLRLNPERLRAPSARMDQPRAQRRRVWRTRRRVLRRGARLALGPGGLRKTRADHQAAAGDPCRRQRRPARVCATPAWRTLRCRACAGWRGCACRGTR